MSNFNVLVRLPASKKESDFEDEISKLMIPYKESGSGDPEMKPYLEFVEEEAEYEKKYATESSRMIRLADGSTHSAYDDRFRNPELLASPQFIVPEGATEYEFQHKERFATFEQYMTEYCGYESRDETYARYGHWTNKNAKWDWWAIGGRWTGKLTFYRPEADKDNYKVCFICRGSGTRSDAVYKPEDTWDRQMTPAGHPVIGNGCNCCHGTGWEFKWPSEFKPIGNHLRISALDFDRIESETTKRLDEFWTEWQEFCDGKGFKAFDGPRSRALELGILDCKNGDELTGTEWKTVKWQRDENRYDVYKQVTREDLNKFREVFNPIRPWATLDAGGWIEKGEMGWFGCSDATPDSSLRFAGSFMKWLRSGEKNDWVVSVDCHI